MEIRILAEKEEALNRLYKSVFELSDGGSVCETGNELVSEDRISVWNKVWHEVNQTMRVEALERHGLGHLNRLLED